MDDKGAERIKRAAQDALQAGEPEQALDLLGPLLETRRDDPDALVLAGAALLSAGDASASLTVLDRAALLAPEAATAHYNRGRALERLGRLEDAARAYSRTMDLEPEHAPAANRLRNLLRGDSPASVAPASAGGANPAASMENLRPRRVIRRGASASLQEPAPDELTLRAAAAMAHVVERLEQLVERVDEVSARGPAAVSSPPKPAREDALPALTETAPAPHQEIVRHEPHPDVGFQRAIHRERPDPSLIPSSYGPEMWPGGFQEESPLPNLWQLCGATLQLFLLKPLPWLLPLIAAHALAALLGILLPISPWVELFVWGVAFVCGASPALLVLTDQWILGGEPPPTPYLKRLFGVGRIIVLVQLLILAPVTALLAWRTSLPAPLLNTLALVLSFPFQVLLAPALFIGATEEASAGDALRAAKDLAPRRAWFYLGVLGIVMVGGGGLVAGSVYFLARTFAGAGEGFTTLWWTLGASLGAGLWGAAAIVCGADALATSEVVELDTAAEPALP